jgi:hypothetical protein
MTIYSEDEALVEKLTLFFLVVIVVVFEEFYSGLLRVIC